MNVKNIVREGSKATVTVEVDKELLETGANKAYLKARKNIQIPGFRKGKAPRKLIEAMYGANVFFEDGIEEIFPDIYKAAITDQSLNAVGRPSLQNLEFTDAGAELTLVTELYPEVTLGEYKGLEVERPTASVTEDEVAAELDRMAQNVASIETVDRPAAEGDTAVIDYEGYDDGVAFEGGSAKEYELKLGSGTFIPGFEEQVIGMSAGEEKELHVTFPENYKADLAGKAVIFKVKVHRVTETIVPALDDEFAKDVSEFDTLEALKADIREKRLEEKNKNLQTAFENAAVEKAAENAQADLPEAMIEEEVDHQLDRFGYQLQMSGMSLDSYAKMMGGDLSGLRKAMRPNAEKQAKINVTLAKIADTENVEVTADEIEAEYEKLAKDYEMELDKVKSLAQEDAIREDLRIRKAVRVIVDSAVAVAPKAEEAEEGIESKETAQE